jgi:hypothetical protein
MKTLEVNKIYNMGYRTERRIMLKSETYVDN